MQVQLHEEFTETFDDLELTERFLSILREKGGSGDGEGTERGGRC